jgi:hypothetical protein
MKKYFIVTVMLLSVFHVFARQIVVSRPSQVEDCILRQSDVTYHQENYWSGWNFGASQTLDAGYAIAMWNQWRGNVLIRFDLRGVNCVKVEKVVFRIYKPKNVTQTSGEVPLALYQVMDVNSDWSEGHSESLPEYEAASWQFKGNGKAWAGGENGCSVAGVDYVARPLGHAVANKYRGEWLEFELPAKLVQSWIDDPSRNAGLLIKTDEKQEILGDHVLFYSSEHASGKGPELVIEGKEGKAKYPADINKKFNPRYVLPGQGKAFEQWLQNRNFRYVEWTTDPVVNLQGVQRIYPYYWDVVVEGEYVLPYAYYPFSQSINGIDSMISTRDVEGLRRFQINRLRYLHLWEYVREQRWYDCGDVIEIFSPYQAALIWLGSKKDNGMSFDGVLNKIHPKGEKNLTEEEIKDRCRKEVEECKKNLTLTKQQFDSIALFITEMEYQRCIYYNKCNEAAQQVHRLLAKKNNGKEMIDALGAFMNFHDVYLFYDSYWQMKRWSFLMDHTDMVSFNVFWKKQKFNEYSPERIKDRFKMCAKFWPENWLPLEVKSKNNNW